MRLGATSLTLVRAHARLTERLDPGLSVVDLFTSPTVRGLASLITSRTERDAATPVRPAAGPDGEPAAGQAPPPTDPAARRAHHRRLARLQAAEVAR
ncbi:acyl carrier protein [Actinomadura madurae]|nr:acyl carrier protein [Actinomadura madurae]